MQIGAVELDGGGSSGPHTRVGPARHFSGPRNLQARAEPKFDSLFKPDGFVAGGEGCVRVDEHRGVQPESLIDVDPVHWRQVQLLQFSYAQELDVLESPLLR